MKIYAAQRLKVMAVANEDAARKFLEQHTSVQLGKAVSSGQGYITFTLSSESAAADMIEQLTQALNKKPKHEKFANGTSTNFSLGGRRSIQVWTRPGKAFVDLVDDKDPA